MSRLECDVPETERLYYKDAYLREFNAVVTSCEKSRDGFLATLDRTAFFPEGGGQPCDLGKIGDAYVSNVKESKETGQIFHTANLPLETGAEYFCEIDWDRRFSIMQGHTGEHILSGLAGRLYGVNNIGFHMGGEFITVDFDGVLSEGEIAELECAANGAVFANASVECFSVRGDELSSLYETMPFRSKLKTLAELESVRIVRAGDYDACACCGVHCARTGEIGIIKIVDFMKYKAGVRLFLLCGSRALEDYRRKNAQIYEAGGLLSAKPDMVSEAIRRILAENGRLKACVSDLRLRVFDFMTEKIPKGASNACFIMRGLDADEVRELCVCVDKRLKGERRGGEVGGGYLSIVFSECGGAWKYALIADCEDCARIVTKAVNSRFNGRGGGKGTFSQGAFAGGENTVSASVAEELLKSVTGDFALDTEVVVEGSFVN